MHLRDGILRHGFLPLWVTLGGGDFFFVDFLTVFFWLRFLSGDGEMFSLETFFEGTFSSGRARSMPKTSERLAAIRLGYLKQPSRPPLAATLPAPFKGGRWGGGGYRPPPKNSL